MRYVFNPQSESNKPVSNKPSLSKPALTAMALAAVLLSACGGGGNSTDTNGTTPTPTPVAQTTVPSGTLYLSGDSSAEKYTVSADGTLTKQSEVALCSGIAVNSVDYYQSALQLTQDGGHLYTLSYNTGKVCEYAVAGTVTPLNPPFAAVGADQVVLLRNPTANTLVSYSKSGTFNQFSVNANGQLALVSNVSIGTLTGASAYDGVYAAVYHPNGKILYAVLDKIGTAQPNVFAFDVNADGSLHLNARVPVPLSATVHFSINSGVLPRAVALNPAGTALYVLDTVGHVFQFGVNASGVVAPLATPMLSTGSTGLGDVLVAPSGNSAFISDYQSKLVRQYTVGTDGSLSPSNPATVSVCSASLEKLNYALIDAASPTLYLGCTSAGYGHVEVYAVSAAGTLTLLKDNQLNASVLTTSYGQINGMAISH